MTKISLSIALVAALAASFLFWRNGRLQEDLDRANSTIEAQERAIKDAKRAATVLNDHLKRMRQGREVLDAELRALREQEGYDAPLSPFLSRAFDRM